MKHVLPRLGLAALALAAISPAAANPFGKAAVPGEALAAMRGGFALPGGIDVSIAVQSNTAVNGAPVLRTQFLAGSGAPTLAVFGRTAGPAGLTQLDLKPGDAVAVANGTVSLGNGSGNRITYSQRGLDVTHLTGQSIGSIAANSLDNVAIDTATTVNIDVRGATAFNIGSTMARVDALALEAAARLSR
jgi:hypothetical protein